MQAHQQIFRTIRTTADCTCSVNIGGKYIKRLQVGNYPYLPNPKMKRLYENFLTWWTLDKAAFLIDLSVLHGHAGCSSWALAWHGCGCVPWLSGAEHRALSNADISSILVWKAHALMSFSMLSLFLRLSVHKPVVLLPLRKVNGKI